MPLKKRPLDRRPDTRPSNFRLTGADRANAQRLIDAGWATTFTGAIRFALKVAADEKAGDSAA